MYAKTSFGKITTIHCDVVDCAATLSIRAHANDQEELVQLAGMMGWRRGPVETLHYCDLHPLEKVRQGKKRPVTAKAAAARNRAVDAGQQPQSHS